MNNMKHGLTPTLSAICDAKSLKRKAGARVAAPYSHAYPHSGQKNATFFQQRGEQKCVY